MSSILLPATEAYRIWSRTYDQSPNPIVALEARILSAWMPNLSGKRVIDAGTGTGRWLKYAAARGAHCFGADNSWEMLAAAARRGAKSGLFAGDTLALPVRARSFDLAISSLVMGYVPALDRYFGELARVAENVIVSDLHPEAVQSGWTRGFRDGDEKYEVVCFPHSVEQARAAARAAGLRPGWEIHASFGPQEWELFERAGKAKQMPSAGRTPAVWISAWIRA